MGNCELAGSCRLFSVTLVDLPEVAFLMKARHCERESRDCARRLVGASLGSDRVPDNLYPNQTARANLLIENEAARLRRSPGGRASASGEGKSATA